MRVLTVSDIHVDYPKNLDWVKNLSRYDYRDDILILAGDITGKFRLLEETLRLMRGKFSEVFFMPGNHDLWIHDDRSSHSMEKLRKIISLAGDMGIRTEPLSVSQLIIAPLYGWYDFSFGHPNPDFMKSWADNVSCRWIEEWDEREVTNFFLEENRSSIAFVEALKKDRVVISFSHFLPRIDIMPHFIPLQHRDLYPVLGTVLLEEQIRKLGSRIHVYGHSHVNNEVMKDGVLYVNNAYGYPYETYTGKGLKCIWEI